MSPAAGFLQSLVNPKLVFPDLKAGTADEVLGELAALLEKTGTVRDAADLAERLRRRERDGCTGMGGGVALPHCRSNDVHDVVLAVGTSRRGVDFGAPDGIPVTLIFLILSPIDAPALHLQALARLSRLVRTPGVGDALRRASSGEEIVEALREAEAASAVASV
jgi:PTS system fructose-specific IIC component